MKNKRGLVAVLAGVMIVAGCGNNSKTENTGVVAGEQTSYREIVPEGIQAADEDTSVLKRYRLTEPSYYANDSRQKNTDWKHRFSEGRAWVMYEDESDDLIVALVDEQGTVLFQTSQSGLSKNSDFEAGYVEAMPVTDGVTCIFAREPGGWIGHGFVILDRDGNVLFRSDDGDETTDSYLLGYGNGVFMAETVTKGFSGVKDVFYTIDAHGNETLAQKDLKLKSNDHLHSWFTYLGEDIYCSDYFVYNRAEDCMYGTENHSVSRPFINGMSFTESYSRIITTEDLKDTKSFGAYLRANNKGEHEAEGVFHRPSGTYVKEPDYGKDVKMVGDTSFYGDYASVYYIGADKKHYVTLMDKNGKAQYDPIPIDNLPSDTPFSFSTANACSWEGYIMAKIDEEVVVITPEGKTIKCGDAALAGVFTDDTILRGHGYSLYGMYMAYTNSNGYGLRRVDGGATIEYAQVTSATKTLD